MLLLLKYTFLNAFKEIYICLVFKIIYTKVKLLTLGRARHILVRWWTYASVCGALQAM